MDVEKLTAMMNAFVVSQFSYCPLVWMFNDRLINKKINKFLSLATVLLSGCFMIGRLIKYKQNTRESFENRIQE